MSGIVIEAPILNPNKIEFRRYSFDEESRKLLRQGLSHGKISPLTHPLVADICAGDGTVASLLIEEGWLPENITCFDKYISPSPLVEGVNWRYWDIPELAHARIFRPRTKLPQEVLNSQGRFDLMTLFAGVMEREPWPLKIVAGVPSIYSLEKTIGRFLVRQRPKGKIIVLSYFTVGIPHSRERW